MAEVSSRVKVQVQTKVVNLAIKVKATHKDAQRVEETVMLSAKDKQTDRVSDNASAMVMQTAEANGKNECNGWRTQIS